MTRGAERVALVLQRQRATRTRRFESRQGGATVLAQVGGDTGGKVAQDAYPGQQPPQQTIEATSNGIEAVHPHSITRAGFHDNGEPTQSGVRLQPCRAMPPASSLPDVTGLQSWPSPVMQGGRQSGLQLEAFATSKPPTVLGFLLDVRA